MSGSSEIVTPKSDTAAGELAQIRLLVAAELAQVEEQLAARLGKAVPMIKQAYTHTVQAGGKRLRPLLVLLAARSVGEVGPEAVQLAVAIEEVHIASMLHDDVVDYSQVRRGQASVQALWDNRIAVLTGDYVAADVYHLLSGYDQTRYLETIAQAVVKMCEAQARELNADGLTRTEAEYLEIIESKTASLMAAAASVGGYAANGSAEQINALNTYGHRLGMAFQISDDLLDLYGESAELGKPIGKDLRAGQLTLPAIFACHQPASDELRGLLAELHSDSPPEIVAEAADLIAALGGRGHAEEKAAEFTAQAAAALAGLPNSEAHDALIALAEFVGRRAW